MHNVGASSFTRWKEFAICSDMETSEFFPGIGSSVRRLRKICCRCPVQQTCLDYALENNEEFGVWGGKTVRERRKIRRRRKDNGIFPKNRK